MQLNRKTPMISKPEAEEILREVFMDNYIDMNSVPLEQLQSYSEYRKERVSLGKVIAVIAMVAFLFLPILFVMPDFTVSEEAMGERGLPVYTVHVKSYLLPVKSVTGVLHSYSLPVYPVDGKTYTIEPTTNGEMVIDVTLFNDQHLKRKVEVTAFDEEIPVLDGSAKDGDTMYLYVSDSGSGIAYEEAYAVRLDGSKVEASGYDETECYIEFDRVSQIEYMIIPDKAGNELKVQVTR